MKEELIRKVAEDRHRRHQHAELGIRPVGPKNGCSCWIDATHAVNVLWKHLKP